MDQEAITRMAKQRYLVKEILEQGYDQNTFSSFMLKRRKAASYTGSQGPLILNIDDWTFDELDKAVQDFHEEMRNPYIKESVEDRFIVKTNEEEQWEDLDYAEENEDFGRVSLHKRLSVAEPIHTQKEPQRMDDHLYSSILDESMQNMFIQEGNEQLEIKESPNKNSFMAKQNNPPGKIFEAGIRLPPEKMAKTKLTLNQEK